MFTGRPLISDTWQQKLSFAPVAIVGTATTTAIALSSTTQHIIQNIHSQLHAQPNKDKQRHVHQHNQTNRKNKTVTPLLRRPDSLCVEGGVGVCFSFLLQLNSCMSFSLSAFTQSQGKNSCSICARDTSWYSAQKSNSH